MSLKYQSGDIQYSCIVRKKSLSLHFSSSFLYLILFNLIIYFMLTVFLYLYLYFIQQFLYSTLILFK